MTSAQVRSGLRRCGIALLVLGATPSVASTVEQVATTTRVNGIPSRLPGAGDADCAFVHVSLGNFHGLATTADGSVYAWGEQPGGGAADVTSVWLSPLRIDGLPPIAKLCADQVFSLALARDGSVWAWGENESGQLGDGTRTERPRPVQVTGLPPALDITTGLNSSFALAIDGTTWAWGANTCHSLGTGGGPGGSLVPVPVPGLVDIVALSTGWAGTTVAIGRDGRAWTWGCNGHGRLGDGTTVSRETPVLIAGLDTVRAVATSGNHGLALLADGTVWGWGYNGNGEVGDGTTEDRWSPVPVPGMTDVVAVHAGFGHSLALKSDGSTWAWGANDEGELADDTFVNASTPQRVEGIPAAASLAAGLATSGIVGVDGSSWSWGLSAWGQLNSGHLEREGFRQAVLGPGRLARLLDVQRIGCGFGTSFAVTGDGLAWSWGDNESGQLGRPVLSGEAWAGEVSGLGSVVAVTGGDGPDSHSLAVTADGRAWGWGENSYGQVGDGTTTDRFTPAALAGLVDVRGVAAGRHHSLAWSVDGRAWSWGGNDAGQLGDGLTASRPLPAVVPSLPPIRAMAAGSAFSLALAEDGSAWSWGGNDEGQLGDGTASTRPTPAPIPGLADVVALSAGARHVLALTTDGRVWTWGANGYGQLGDGTTAGRRTPAAIDVGGRRIVAVGAGTVHSIALAADGSVWSWGSNAANQLGDGTRVSRSVPGRVVALEDVVAVACGPNTPWRCAPTEARGAGDSTRTGSSATVTRKACPGPSAWRLRRTSCRRQGSSPAAGWAPSCPAGPLPDLATRSGTWTRAMIPMPMATRPTTSISSAAPCTRRGRAQARAS